MHFRPVVTKATSKNILKGVLAARGLTYHDLAEKTGLAWGTIKNVASGSCDSRPARRKIEAALGIRVWPEAEGAPQGANAETVT